MPVFNRLLVAFDGSDASRGALSKAVELARDGARLRVLHVIEPVAYMTEFPVGSEQLFESVRQSAGRLLDEAVDLAKAAGVDADRLVVDDGTRLGEAVAREGQSWRADLIVVGTHGRHGPSRLILGSGAEQILRHSATAVLTIPVAGD